MNQLRSFLVIEFTAIVVLLIYALLVSFLVWALVLALGDSGPPDSYDLALGSAAFAVTFRVAIAVGIIPVALVAAPLYALYRAGYLSLFAILALTTLPGLTWALTDPPDDWLAWIVAISGPLYTLLLHGISWVTSSDTNLNGGHP